MAAYMSDYALDALVEKIREATKLHICSALPATYAEASSDYMLGTKDTPTMGAVSDRTGGGRKTTVSAITDGAVNPGADTAAFWALVDHANSRLLAAGELTNDQLVVNGNTFTLAAFDVGVADAT